MNPFNSDKEINEAPDSRRGARSFDDIPADIQRSLNEGKIESVNMIEWLSVDHLILIDKVLRLLLLSLPLSLDDVDDFLRNSRAKLLKTEKLTAIKATRLVAKSLVDVFKEAKAQSEIVRRLRIHESDTIRGYAAFMIGYQTNISVRAKLSIVQPLAADSHFNVRELAWMAVRGDIANDLDNAIDILSLWVKKEDPNIRRFAIEATRPRGVWCKHIEELKDNPRKGLVLLDPCRQDDSAYVRDSVGNWLNDASKTRPDFVREVCGRWLKFGDSNTEYIVKKALRTIGE